jgi:hypothetical protein
MDECQINENKKIELNYFLNIVILFILKHISSYEIYNKENLLIKYNNLKKKKERSKNISNSLHRKNLDELYVTTLNEIDNKQLVYKNLVYKKNNNNERNRLLIELLETISISNFYASEAYICIGTIYHVLGYIQKLGNFYMYSEYYIQSMFENLIDTMRYCEYIYKDNNKFIFKISKYLYRIYDGILRYLEMKGYPLNNIESKKKLFNNIRLFYQKNSTKKLSQKIINDLDKFCREDTLNNVNNLNNININLVNKKELNINNSINILYRVLNDIIYCISI